MVLPASRGAGTRSRLEISVAADDAVYLEREVGRAQGTEHALASTSAMNGTTIEILNTDAEGRLVLADALVYAERRTKPDAIVDLATLTGAVITALGHELTGVMGNDERLRDELLAAGKATGELAWPLPLLDQHKEQMKGAVGDLKNINAGQGAGSSAGAAFLSHFVGKTPWAHLDIAGTAWGGEDRDYQGGSGGTGVGVRLLVRWLEERARAPSSRGRGRGRKSSPARAARARRDGSRNVH